MEIGLSTGGANGQPHAPQRKTRCYALSLMTVKVEPDVPIGLGTFASNQTKPVEDNGLHLELQRLGSAIPNPYVFESATISAFRQSPNRSDSRM